MIRRKRSNIEPWIEALVQNYGQQGKAKIQKGYVLKVAELPESCPQKENAVALLVISDGRVYIPAVLTKQAWEEMQEVEERVVVSSLKESTVCLRVYSLDFHCEAEMCKSKFFLIVEKMAEIAFGAMTDSVPCWSLQGDDSFSMETQSGNPLSEFLIAWSEDEMRCLLSDLKTRLAPPLPPSPCFRANPQPSSSRANPPPSARSSYLPTGWQADRVRYKGQEAYTFTLSHFYIPAEQIELIQRHLVNGEERTLPDSGEDGSSPMASGEQEERPVNPWDIFASRVENLSTSSLEVSLSASPMHDPPLVGQSPSLLLPLDRVRAAVPTATSPLVLPVERPSSSDLFVDSDQSSGDVPATTEDQPEGPAPKPLPLEPHHLEPSHANSDTQPSTGSSTPSLIREISTGSNNQTLPPYQKPRPHNASSCSPVRDGSSHFIFDAFASSTQNPERPPVLLTSSPDFCWDKPATPQQGPSSPPILKVEEGVITVESRSARKKRWPAEADAAAAAINSFREAEEEAGERRDSRVGRNPKRKQSQTGSPPSWLYHKEDGWPCEVGATAEEGCPASATNIRSVIMTHPDGTPFIYRYEPTPRIAKALSLFKVPDDLVRWSVRYLSRPAEHHLGRPDSPERPRRPSSRPVASPAGSV